MRVTLAATVAILFVTVPALADEFVNGYYRQNGTYVQPHMRSSPDGNPFNNYSTQGNVANTDPVRVQTGKQLHLAA
jgi:hypothetical protein